MILVIVRLLSLHRAPDLFEQRLNEPKQIDFHVRRQARWRWLDGVEQVWRFALGSDWHRLAPAFGNRTANSLGARLFPCVGRAGLRAGSRDQPPTQNRLRPLQTSMPEGARPCRRAGAPRKSQDPGNISVPQWGRVRRIAGETDRKSSLREVRRAVCRHYVV